MTPIGLRIGKAPLAIIGFLFGIVGWWMTGRLTFVLGAILLVANWPWTIATSSAQRS